MERETERLLRRDTAVMSNVSGDRLRHEIERILQEKRPEEAITRAAELGVLEQIATGLRANGWMARRFAAVRRARAELETDGAVYVGLMAWRLKETSLQRFTERMRFSGNVARMLRDLPRLKRDLVLLEASDLRPSATYGLLEPYHELAVMVAAFATRSRVARQRLNAYLTQYKSVETALNGDDLKAMGVPAGKKMGRMLRQLKEARLDRKAASREDEEKLVRRWLA
jgi:tRNA nucleotidyltransferase (CCA-adding enzyme)